MTCSDVMTSNLACCYPTDTVARAAEIMRDEDVGPVPVLDPSSGDLEGLVTDRDIAIKAVATGRDCGSLEVREIMSRDLVTCRIDDDYRSALDAMSRYQVRRIPVVHEDGALAGIISQADVARFSSEAETGQVVEDISDASSGFDLSLDRRESGAGSLIAGAAGFTIGAICMYMLDPDRGRTRRAKARDKAVRAYHDSAWAAGKVGRDLSNRATGTYAEMKHRLSREEDVPEPKLIARVRSTMGHYISHPHAIQVSATPEGRIQLSGDILSDEVSSLLSAIRSVPGVSGIDNSLNVHESAEGVPSLQGGSERGRSDLSPGMRFLAAILGTGLAFYGMKTRGTVAKTAGTLGLGLVASGVTNVPMGDLANTVMQWRGSQEIH